MSYVISKENIISDELTKIDEIRAKMKFIESLNLSSDTTAKADYELRVRIADIKEKLFQLIAEY